MAAATFDIGTGSDTDILVFADWLEDVGNHNTTAIVRRTVEELHALDAVINDLRETGRRRARGMTIDEMIREVEALQNASGLDGSDAPLRECSQSREGGCLRCEEDRPLSRAEKDKGWARRPWHAYDADKMCRGCRIYWMLGNIANDLREEKHWQLVIKAEEERKVLAAN